MRCLICSKDTILCCSLCQNAYYCSEDCQIEDWKSKHFNTCIGIEIERNLNEKEKLEQEYRELCKKYGSESYQVIPQVILLFKCELANNNKVEAFKYLQIVTTIIQQINKSKFRNESQFSSLLGMLGQFWQEMENNEIAEKFYLLYLDEMHEIFGSDHLIMSDCYNAFSSFYTREKQYNQAILYLSRSLVIRLSNLGILHLSTASTHYNLGLLYRLQGNFNCAIRETKIALFIYKSIRVENDASNILTSECEANFTLANLYMCIAEVENGKKYFEEACSLKCFLAGFDDNSTITTLNSLNVCRNLLNMESIPRESILLGTSNENLFSKILFSRNKNKREHHSILRNTEYKRGHRDVTQNWHGADNGESSEGGGIRLDNGKGTGRENESEFTEVGSKLNSGGRVEEKESRGKGEGEKKGSDGRQEERNREEYDGGGGTGGGGGYKDWGRLEGGENTWGRENRWDGTKNERSIMDSIVYDGDGAGGYQVKNSTSLKKAYVGFYGSFLNKTGSHGFGSIFTTNNIVSAPLVGNNSKTNNEEGLFINVSGNKVGSTEGEGGNIDSNQSNNNTCPILANGANSNFHSIESSSSLVQNSVGGQVIPKRHKITHFSGTELFKVFEKSLFATGLFINKLKMKINMDKKAKSEKSLLFLKKASFTFFCSGIFVKLLRDRTERGPKYDGPKLKNIHWDTLKSSEGTVFQRRQSTASLDFGVLFRDVDEDFLLANKTKENKKEKDESETIVSFLDAKRKQNMSIALKSFKISMEEVLKGINSLNINNTLDAGQVASLLKIIPTSEEIALAHNASVAVRNLGNAELFISLCIDSESWLENNLKVIKFRFDYPEISGTLHSNIQILLKSCKEILESKVLRKIMIIILELGNLLNRGSKKGGAAGFKLNGLQKLASTKSNKGVTLMEYLIEHLETNMPEFLCLADEFSHLKQASTLSLSSAKSDLLKIKGNLNQIHNLSNSLNSSGYVASVEYIAPFFDQVNNFIKDSSSSLAELETTFVTLCKYLGEECPPLNDTDKLISLLNSFVNDFEGAKDKLRKERERKIDAINKQNSLNNIKNKNR